MHGDSKLALAATIMTEDAKTEEYTAGAPCGAYIEMPCKFAACRALRIIAIPCRYKKKGVCGLFSLNTRCNSRQIHKKNGAHHQQYAEYTDRTKLFTVNQYAEQCRNNGLYRCDDWNLAGFVYLL